MPHSAVHYQTDLKMVNSAGLVAMVFLEPPALEISGWGKDWDNPWEALGGERRSEGVELSANGTCWILSLLFKTSHPWDISYPKRWCMSRKNHWWHLDLFRGTV